MSFISHVFLFLFTFILFHVQQGSCQKLPLYRDDYTYDAREKAFFKLHPEKRKWREAAFMCAGEGSQLDAPESKAQTRQLLSIMTSDMQMIWLGINDIAKEGKFVTTNGSDAVFTDWASGQPNNKDGTEDCVVLSNNGRFISISCNAKQSYICKKHISTLTTNDECETHDLSYVYNQEADRCYKVHKVPRIWNNARKVCEAEKAHLGIINSRDEAIIFLENLNLHPKNTLMNSINKDAMHVGFREFSGVFKAINGKTLNESGFQEWNAGEPAELGVRRCGSILRSGKLTTVACNVKGLFICEKPLGQNVVLNLDMRFGLEDEDEESVVVDENGEELYIFN